MSHFASTFPALEGGVVTQGHADYCRNNGHATNTILGTNALPVEISERCPRCGDLLSAEYLKAKLVEVAAEKNLDVAKLGAFDRAWKVAVKRDQAIVDVAAKRAARREAEREAFEKAEAADAALTYVPRPGDVVTNEAGHFGIVTEFVKKSGIHKGRISVMWTHQNYEVAERPSAVTVIPKSDVAAFLAALKPEPEVDPEVDLMPWPTKTLPEVLAEREAAKTEGHKHGETESDVDPATYGACPEKTNGRHSIEWIKRPAAFHNGEQVSGDEWRGFCWACDERFTEGA